MLPGPMAHETEALSPVLVVQDFVGDAMSGLFDPSSRFLKLLGGTHCIVGRWSESKLARPPFNSCRRAFKAGLPSRTKKGTQVGT